MPHDRSLILSIDIGGSGTKAALINNKGRMVSQRLRLPTPYPASPEVLTRLIQKLVKPFKRPNRVAVGFPGLVRNNRVYSAPNLGNSYWKDVPFAEKLHKKLRAPVRIINDAEMQGLSVIRGKGMELALTLGTGVGIAIFVEGQPLPHLELSQHPVHKGKTYDEYLGEAARKKLSKTKWINRIEKVLDVLKVVVAFDRVYVGGGNARKIKTPLKHNAVIVPNRAGLLGAAALWRLKHWPEKS